MTIYKIYKCLLIVLIAACVAQLAPVSALGGENQQRQLELVATTLSAAAKRGDYSPLLRFVPKGKELRWGYCNSDMGWDITAEDLVRHLSENSKGVIIAVNQRPLDGLVETSGWVGEYIYEYFQFTRVNENWKWIGGCKDSSRLIEFEQAYGPELVSLPRPGPRVFEGRLALRDRLQEIARFKQFDALRVYAVRDKLVLGLCQGDARTKQHMIKGHVVSANEVIEFLKTGIIKYSVPESSGFLGNLIQDARDLFLNSDSTIEPAPVYTGSPDMPLFETKIVGSHPYVLFWADTSKNRWEWSGVSYCRVPHRALLFPDDPRYQQDKNK